MDTTPKPTQSPTILQDEAGAADVRNEISNVADRAAISAPAHRPLLTNAFLKALDPNAERFTFQLFRDPKHRKNETTPHGLRLINHSTIDEAVALAAKWNTPDHAYGMYVTINQTDLGGRTRKNVIRVRAVYVDVDEDLKGVVARLQGLLKPSAVVESSRGRAQIYWWVDDAFPLDQFERIQRALISKLGTDPQVHDLPRVMRLPGSLHLKTEPRLVKIRLGDRRRHSIEAIIEGLGLAPFMGAAENTPTGAALAAFPQRPPLLNPSELSAGILPPPFDFGKALSAGKALAAAGKLDGRDGWLNLWLFPLTHEAQQHPEIEHDLKSLHDEVAALSADSAASRGAQGTDVWAAGNEVQWVNALQRSPANPRTMGSVYDAALAIGWAPPVTSAGNTGVALDGEIIAPSAAPATFCADLRPLPPIPGGHYSEADGLRLFLERYAFIREGGTASYFLCDAEGRLVRTDDTSIEAELSNVYVWTGGASDSSGEMRKAKSHFSWWKATTSRPQIRVAVFKPHGGVAAHEFNMWRGWGVEPLPGREKMRRLLYHIRQIICRRDRRKFRYLMRWLAWTVQNPDKAPGVAVVLQSSREGAGKSALSEVMLKLFGVHGTIVDTPDGLLGKHNDNLEFACFVAVKRGSATPAGLTRSTPISRSAAMVNSCVCYSASISDSGVRASLRRQTSCSSSKS